MSLPPLALALMAHQAWTLGQGHLQDGWMAASQMDVQEPNVLDAQCCFVLICRAA
jgi:hypothetical protein